MEFKKSNNTCWTCSQRIGEECGIDGHEVYPNSEACREVTMDFEEIGNVAGWAVDLANKNAVAVSEVIDLYKEMRKNHSNEEAKKLVEGIYEVVRGRR